MWTWIRRWCQQQHESSVIIDIWMDERINIYRLEQVPVDGSLSISSVPPMNHEWQLRFFFEQGHSCWNMNYHSYYLWNNHRHRILSITHLLSEGSFSDDPCQWMMMMESMNDGDSLFLHSFIPQGQGHSGLRRRLNSVLLANLQSKCSFLSLPMTLNLWFQWQWEQESSSVHLLEESIMISYILALTPTFWFYQQHSQVQSVGTAQHSTRSIFLNRHPPHPK